ncbi:hypothetical protein Tco_0569826 [Tanacetum coccineum]
MAEESRLKMLAKQNDLTAKEEKVNIAPIDYVTLNKVSEHFVKHFVPQKELSIEHAFWLPISQPNSEIQPVEPKPVVKEIPRELPPIRKSVSEGDKSANNSKVIAPGMHKLDLEPLSPMLIRNKEAHIDYLKYTQEHANTLYEIVEHARDLRPLNSDLDSACKSATRVQELLVYVRETCPSSTRQRKKLIGVTLINRVKKVRFVEPSTLSSYTHKQIDSYKTKDSNSPLFPSTGVIGSTSASGSKPQGNTKKNRISRPTSSNKKNKVEYHLWRVKPSLNKMNRVSEPVCNENVAHSILNANFELICATCNECMFDSIHDLCVLDYLNDVNVHAKPKSVKSKKKKMWKPTGQVYTNVGYS